MPDAPYLNDNPFRVLGIGSAVTQADLLQTAELSENLAAIGIPPATGLLQLFGANNMPRCLQKVKALRGDLMERTLYRLFWPFEYKPNPAFTGTLADLGRLEIPQLAPSFRALQVRFVLCWSEYLVTPSPQTIQTTLETFDSLRKDKALADFLAELLVKDGEAQERAKSIGSYAPQVALDRILPVFSRQIAQWWENGDMAATTMLAAIFFGSTVDPDIVNKLFSNLIALGEREADRIQALLQNSRGWSLVQSPSDIAELEKFQMLARVFQGRVPVAERWLNIVGDRLRQVAPAVLEQAIGLAKHNDSTRALQILTPLLNTSLPEDIARRVREIYAQLQHPSQPHGRTAGDRSKFNGKGTPPRR